MNTEHIIVCRPKPAFLSTVSPFEGFDRRATPRYCPCCGRIATVEWEADTGAYRTACERCGCEFRITASICRYEGE